MYVNPCQIFQDCIGERPAINYCSLIPWIVQWQPWVAWALPWYILWVNASWSCVERKNPCSLLNLCWVEDVNVKVTNNDTTTWKLFDKIVSCWPDLTISVLNPGWDEKLELCVSAGCKVFTCLDDVPDVYPACDGYVRFNNDQVYFECNTAWLRGERYAWSNIVIPQDANTIQFHWSPGSSWDLPDIPLSIYQWNPTMNGWANWEIIITKTWMYNVWIKGSAQVNEWVQAMRVVLVTTNSKQVLADAKWWWANAPVWPLLPANAWWGQRPQWFYEFYAHNLVRLNAWDIISYAIRIDSNAGNWIPASVTLFRSVLGDWVLSSPIEVPDPMWWMTFWCSFYSTDVFNAS